MVVVAPLIPEEGLWQVTSSTCLSRTEEGCKAFKAGRGNKYYPQWERQETSR